MLEIPESHSMAKQLQSTVKGKRITEVIAGHSPHGFAFYSGEPSLYPQILVGKTLQGAKAFGGQVEIQADDARILFNDGVNIRYLDAGSQVPKKHQLYLQFDDESFIYCTVQMYGGLNAYYDGDDNDNFYHLVAREKPNPLTDTFDRSYFDSLFKDTKSSLSAKAFLATEQRIPGLGNGVLQDILFLAGIHPKKKLQDLTDRDRENMYLSVKGTLKNMAENGGRDTEKDLFGNSGGYRTLLSAKTLSDPCPSCGGAIVRQAYLGGNVYFCPVCQPLSKQ